MKSDRAGQGIFVPCWRQHVRQCRNEGVSMCRALASTPMHKHPRRFDHGRNVLVLENDIYVERERACTMGVKARCGPRLKQEDVAPLQQRHSCHHIDNPTANETTHRRQP